jgi:hypothetical protein
MAGWYFYSFGWLLYLLSPILQGLSLFGASDPRTSALQRLGFKIFSVALATGVLAASIVIEIQIAREAWRYDIRLDLMILPIYVLANIILMVIVIILKTRSTSTSS